MRSAITLGLNLMNNSLKIRNILKEARYKVWWCIYSLEHMLGTMTGRAFFTFPGGHTIPLPLPFEEDQLEEDPAAIEVLNDHQLRNERINNVMASSWIGLKNGNRDRSQLRDQSWVKGLPANSGLYYLYYCDLTVITQEVLKELYSTNCVALPWSEIEKRTDELRSRFDSWRSNLPMALDFTQNKNSSMSSQLRCNLRLGFQYYSARIILGRPYLCRLDTGQDNFPQTFSHMMTVLTLQSASDLIDLIPDEPNVPQLYSICQWWCILRQLMQAAIVILLELSFNSVHMPEEEEKFARLAKKCISWFFAMPGHSARRAWQLCDSSFRKLARGTRFSTDDMPLLPRQHYSSSNAYESHLRFQPMTSPYHDNLNLQPEEIALVNSHPVPEAGSWTNYLNLSTPDLMSSLQGPVEMADSYFSCDPFGDYLIRSLFPSREEDSREDV